MLKITEVFADAEQRWPAIFRAASASSERIERLRAILSPILADFGNTTVVAFGSLARRETTRGSDVDWAVLHDGPATRAIRQLPNRVAEVLEREGIKRPADTSEFGKLVSGLEILDGIASRKDARLPLSRRLLLVLESVAFAGDPVRDRLVHEILDAYRDEETLSNKSQRCVPRYLLNDLNQFWRLMCTDYSGMTRAAKGKHWGLRSIKLNYSRKLFFVSGVLKCLRCDRDVRGLREDGATGARSLLDEIYASFRVHQPLTPLETVGTLFPKKYAEQILTEYDHFLATIDDEGKRQELADLEYAHSDDNELLTQLWARSRIFHHAIVSGMLDDEELGPLVRGCLIL